MKTVELIFSKTKVDKSGEALKKNGLQKDERQLWLEVLSNWRAFHVMSLDSFAKVLRARVKKISDNGIIAQRLKRTPSIILKLRKHKTMRLSTMQDIGGLRAILDNNAEVYDLVETYTRAKSRHELFSLDDYILRPKKDGYRGIHLVYKLTKEPSIFLEIQVRSTYQHIWATAVEVFGTLKNSSFKSGFGDKLWLDFFQVLSSCFALKEGSNVLEAHKNLSNEELLDEAKKYIEELKVIEQLSVYTAIYKLVSVENKEKGRRGGYSLLTLDSNKSTIDIKSFGANQIEEATKFYLNLENDFFDDSNMNVVLVNTGDVKKLEASYPNYFMDAKKLVIHLSEIIMDRFL